MAFSPWPLARVLGVPVLLEVLRQVGAAMTKLTTPMTNGVKLDTNDNGAKMHIMSAPRICWCNDFGVNGDDAKLRVYFFKIIPPRCI